MWPYYIAAELLRLFNMKRFPTLGVNDHINYHMCNVNEAVKNLVYVLACTGYMVLAHPYCTYWIYGANTPIV